MMTDNERRRLDGMLDNLCSQVHASGTFACQEVLDWQRRIVEYVDRVVRSRDSAVEDDPA